jgi:hypothetical protein
MKISFKHQRALAGNDLTVGVEAEGKERISHVTITLDGFAIVDDGVDPPGVSYERQLLQAGDASPLLPHQLTITITDPEGNISSADRRWEDAN